MKNPRMHPQMTLDDDKGQMSASEYIATLKAENIRLKTELNVAVRIRAEAKK